jgi:capsular polysaccharide biosynthesis protein
VHLITSNSGSHFFGTLIVDDFPLALLPSESDVRITMMSRPSTHEADYRRLVKLPAAKRITYGRIKRLVIYTDFAQNSLKEERYRVLRSDLRASLSANRLRPAPGVYIRRGATGERRLLVNETAVEHALIERGFRVIDIQSMTAETIARETLDARIVVGVEGSHLSHGIFSAHEDATFVILQPPQRFSMSYKEFTDRLGMRFAFLVADLHPEGFSVSITHLNRLIDVVETHS